MAEGRKNAFHFYEVIEKHRTKVQTSLSLFVPGCVSMLANEWRYLQLLPKMRLRGT